MDASDFRDRRGATPIRSARDLWDLERSFADFFDVFVIAAECRTGRIMRRNLVWRDGEENAILVLASDWVWSGVLVLYLDRFAQVDVRHFGHYGSAVAFWTEDEFRLEFPDGARVAAKSASYRFVTISGALPPGAPATWMPRQD